MELWSQTSCDGEFHLLHANKDMCYSTKPPKLCSKIRLLTSGNNYSTYQIKLTKRLGEMCNIHRSLAVYVGLKTVKKQDEREYTMHRCELFYNKKLFSQIEENFRMYFPSIHNCPKHSFQE